MIDPGKVIESLALFRLDQKLLIGVSGGVDSMVLTKVLIEQGYQLGLAHVNYKLRAEESDLDEALIRDFATENNVPFYCKECPLNQISHIQEDARKLRYAFFENLKSEFGYHFILTAHHADDQIEGFFLHLFRGSGLKGLSGMDVRSGDLIRPFLSFRKAEILEYAIANNIPFRQDQSNSSTYYSRNFLRNEIFPLLQKRFPSFDEMVLRSMDHIHHQKIYFEEEYLKWFASVKGAATDLVEISQDSEKSSGFLSYFLAQEGFHPNIIKDILKHNHSSGRIFKSSSGGTLLVDRNRMIYNRRPTDEVLLSYEINRTDTFVQTKFGNFAIDCTEPGRVDYSDAKSNTIAVFDADLLNFPLSIRQWRPGDRISPFGKMSGSRKLQDVFADHKIDLFSKKRIPVCCSGDSVIWVPGLIRSRDAILTSSSKKVMRISWTALN